MNINHIIEKIEDPIVRKAFEEVSNQSLKTEDILNLFIGVELGFKETIGEDGKKKIEIISVEACREPFESKLPPGRPHRTDIGLPRRRP